MQADTNLRKKRTNYPFDDPKAGEYYMSEYEEEDEDSYIIDRGSIKDNMEQRLRKIDKLENKQAEGDENITERFRSFLQEKKGGLKKDGKYQKVTELSTINMYCNAIQQYILPAFHRICVPFHAYWLLDCEEHKECTMDGKKRSFVSPKEPIYITPSVIDAIISTFMNNIEENGNQIATILAAAGELMDFVEFRTHEYCWIYTLKSSHNIPWNSQKAH